MLLAAGVKIGSYEIVSPLGAGGMGEVYRARDTKLHRDVAIKVLLPEVANDRDRLARFSREAQLLAALNHPNIAQIYGLEDSSPSASSGDAAPALVMELVEGEGLGERIARSPLGVAEGLGIARQIADALETAHDQGIIHRDLKPANIKIRADGTVKILDFGLAKALDPASSASGSATMSPTLSIHATQAGIILGTAAYMPPEQARGKPVDKRADIWAFGCVLYELLTGARAFPGDDVTDTIVSVVSKEPDWQALPLEASRVAALIRRCLKKDPKARMRDIGEARLQIDEILSGAPEPAGVAAAPERRRGRTPLTMQLLATVMIAGIAAAATWFATRPRPPAPMVPTRFVIVPPPSQPLSLQGQDRDIVISPDGRHIVYRAGVGRAVLVVREIDQLEARPITSDVSPGTGQLATPRSPFFSPDGQWVGFFEQNSLKKVPISGGPAVTICPATANRGAAWSDDNTIVFATTDLGTGLMSVSANGGEPKVLTKPNMPLQEGDHYFPALLPNGRGILFTIVQAAGRAINTAQIAVLDLKTGQTKSLIRGGYDAEYVEPAERGGYLLFAVSDTLRAVRFDLEKLEVVGPQVPVVERVAVAPNGAANFSASREGTLVYVPGGAAETTVARSLVWVDRQKREEAIDAPSRGYVVPRLSPDNTRIALDIRDQDNDIWVWHLARHTLTRLTFDPAFDAEPVWTPDGNRIIFSSNRGGSPNLYSQAADGTGVVERLTNSQTAQYATSITPDAKILVGYQVAGAPDIVSFPLDGGADGKTRRADPLIKTEFVEVLPELSPNGRYVVYFSNESGPFDVYVRPFPNVDAGRWQVSTGGGGTRPVWAKNGRELFYLDEKNALTVVPVDTAGTAFTFGNPSMLLDPMYFGAPGPRPYDVSSDGQRFLMIKNAAPASGEKATPASLIVVQHWFEELKARMAQ